VLLRPARGAWDWAAESKLFVPVENLEVEAVTLLLRIESEPGHDLRGKVAIAPLGAGDAPGISRSGSTRPRPAPWA
jgi:hypothetical protein